VNHAPSFTAGANQIVNEDSGAHTVAAWAGNIFAGAANEAGQTLDFLVSNDNPGLFAIAPAIASDGTLTYTSAHDANGSATVKVRLHDNGRTAGGGNDTSAEQTFTITVTAVNDAPVTSTMRRLPRPRCTSAPAHSRAMATCSRLVPMASPARALRRTTMPPPRR
jgi:hypothetical protein